MMTCLSGADKWLDLDGNVGGKNGLFRYLGYHLFLSSSSSSISSENISFCNIPPCTISINIPLCDISFRVVHSSITTVFVRNHFDP